MEPLQTDDGSTLISLEASSSPSPSLGGPPSDSNPHHAVEFLHSVPFSQLSETASVGDDVEEVGTREDHVAGVVDAPVSSYVPLPKHNYGLDIEAGDVIIESEVTLSSGMSSFSPKQFSSGSPTSYTELVHSIPSFPSSLPPQGLSTGIRSVGQESIAVEGINAAFVDQEDTTIAVQFASPTVVADHDDDIADTGERTSSTCEGVGYVSSSPPPYASSVELGSPVAGIDHVDVVKERSLSWEWPRPFTEEHEYDVASPAALADDHGVAIEERASSPDERPVPVTSSPFSDTTVGVEFSVPADVAGVSEDNDDTIQEGGPSAGERPEHVPSSPLPYTSVAVESSSPAPVADHNGDAIQEPESSRGERPEIVPRSPHPYTMTVEFSSRGNVANGDAVIVQELEYSSTETHRPLSPPPSTMAVDFASPPVAAFDNDVAIQERASSPGERPLADVPSPPLQFTVAAECAFPLVTSNDDVWDDTVADESAPSVSVPHDDIVVVQEAMTMEISSPTVFRDDDGSVIQDRMAVEFASPALVPDDDVAILRDTMAVVSPSSAACRDDGVVVAEGTTAVEFTSSEVVPNEDVVVLHDTGAVELASRAIVLDDDPMVVQDAMVDEFGVPGVVPDEDVVLMQDAIAVEPPSPAAVRDNSFVIVEDTTAVEFVSSAAIPDNDSMVLQDRIEVGLASPMVIRDNDVLVVEEAMTVDVASPARKDDIVLVQDTMALEFASPSVVIDDNLVVQGRTSSSCAGPRHESSPTPVFVDDSSSGRYKEDFQCRVTDGSSPGERPASISFPKVSEVPVAEEQVSNAAEPSSEPLEVSSPRESPSFPGDAKMFSMNGSEGVSTFLAAEEAAQVENDILNEQHPAKKAKTGGTAYSGPDAVAVILGQTAEIVLVLAGMAQMRAGKVPTSYERELAASAYQNLGILVSQVAPNDLVVKESLERLLQDYHKKKMAQKKREDRAWVEALNEAEALANARAETLARAKAEAAARAQAEVAARAQAEAAARAQAEAEELERRQQAALKAAAVAAANGPSKGGYSSVGGSPLSSGQSAYRVPELAQSPSFANPAVHPNSQVEMASQIVSPMAKAGESARLVKQTEKSMSINGQSHTPVSKPTLGRPPKVRNRLRKEHAPVTIFTPEFLNEVQSQAQDPQKAHVTHKQLCAGVQQFIREHIPPVSQNLQALPPTYISTPFPCQVCKLIAKDTGSVLVCDSCDEVCHVKCVQPPSSRGASKGDWNCPKCLTASRGGKCPSKYGPIRHGSPNSVKLWPPHDTSEGNPESIRSSSNGSVIGEGESASAGRQTGSGLLKVQGKTGLEIDTRAHQSMDDPSTGNFGSSPHLIVHLINEPSPRPSNHLNTSSHSLLQVDNQVPFPSGKSFSSLVLETSPLKVLTKEVAAEDKTELHGQSGLTISGQNDSIKIVHDDEEFERGLEKSYTEPISVVEDTVNEAKNCRASPAHIKKTEPRTPAIQNRKGNVESEVILPGKQADVPLPIVMEWVGESTRKAEGKVYYRACSVGGITFSVSDCALFRPETPDVPPYIARLQVLWEDIATGHKWVRVSWCYYPTDIPLAMGRPGTTAPDEVYESNHCDNNLVGSIQGPCFVLPPLKFREETERRHALEKRGNAVEELPPIFLSRWMYDAPKGVFRPLQE